MGALRRFGLFAALSALVVPRALGHADHGELVEVHGSGTTNPSKFFWDIMERLQAMSHHPITLTYRAVGSGTGQKEFSQVNDGNYTAGVSDFGAGDIPMSNDHYTNIGGAGRGMVHIPFALGAIGIFHSVPAGEVGNQGLRLSPCVLARIFNGDITTWDHADIITENPEMQGVVPAGQKILVGHRRLGSSSTGGLTGYLNAACAAQWPSNNVGSTVTWSTKDNFHQVEGSPGMTEHIAGNAYAIGYLDAGHGHQRNFLEVQLQNPAGTWLDSKSSMAAMDANNNNGVAAAGKAAVDASVIPTNAYDDWSSVNLYNQGGENTWPIVLVSYIYLERNLASWSHEKVSLVKSFIDYVTHADMGQSMLATYSFNMVPTAMNRWAAAGGVWENDITKPSGYMDVFTFETSTEAWIGQGGNVLSVKRNSYSMWKLSELELANQQLQDRVTALEGHLNEYGIVPLHGSGTTNPRNWFAKVMKQVEHRARVPLLLTYRAVGSSTGQKEFVGQASNSWAAYSHFGAGDIPMSAERFQQLQSANRVMLHMPFALGAIGIFHNVPMDQVGAASLKLDGCLLARIFSGKITTWDHADIKQQNPGMNVPAGTVIKVGHRTLGSSSTGGLTGYLNKKCPSEWQPMTAGSTVTWPTSEGFTAVQGSQGMQSHIAGMQYSIGYIDAGHGHDYGFNEVALTNLDGQTRTSKESMAMMPSGVATAGDQQNVFPASPTADWSAVNLFDMPGANTWPIVLVSYLYVEKDQTSTNPRTAAALKAFMHIILNNVDSMAQEFGFTPPATALNNLALDAATQVTYPAGMQSFDFETDTTPLTGMGVNVISGKRLAYDDYERSVLQQDVARLNSGIASLEASVSAITGQPVGTMTYTTTPAVSMMQTIVEEESSAMGVIALIVAIVAMILAAAALGVACMKKSGGGSSGTGSATILGNQASG